jgi:hypothetical protein
MFFLPALGAQATASYTAAMTAQATMAQIMTMFTAAQTAAQFFGQQQMASAQADYQQKMYDQNKKIADQAATDQYQGLGTRTYQEREAAALDIMNASRAAREAMSTARVSAGEAGVAGSSTDALLQDFERRQFEYTYGRSRSQDFREASIEDQKKAIRSQRQGRVLAMLPKPIEKPSFLGAALRIGAGYMDAQRMFSTPVMNPDGGYTLQPYRIS